MRTVPRLTLTICSSLVLAVVVPGVARADHLTPDEVCAAAHLPSEHVTPERVCLPLPAVELPG